MRGFLCVASSLALALTACGGASAPEPSQVNAAPVPARPVTVTCLGAVVAPLKQSGDQWDVSAGFAPPSRQEIENALASIFTVNLAPGKWQPAFAQASVVLARFAASGIAKPDLKGWATLDRGQGEAERAVLAYQGRPAQDTFTATWDPPVSWDGVMLKEGVSLRVHVDDADLRNDDGIETVILSAAQLREVAAIGGNVAVPVRDQGNHQLLFVNLSVLSR